MRSLSLYEILVMMHCRSNFAAARRRELTKRDKTHLKCSYFQCFSRTYSQIQYLRIIGERKGAESLTFSGHFLICFALIH